MSEDRPSDEAKRLLVRSWIDVEDLGAGDVGGHQVGRELNPPELEGGRLREALHDQGLRQPRDTYEHGVTSGDQGDEQLLDHRPLSKNAPFELGGEGRLSRLQRFERLWFVEEGVAWFVEQRAYGSFAGGREVAVYFRFVPTNRSKKTDEG